MPSDSDSTVTQLLLACGAIGAVGFIAVFLIAGALRPDYETLYQPVSSLSLTESGWVQITNFVVTGMLMLACAVGLRRALLPAGGGGATWGPRLIGLFGMGLFAAGVFVTDPAFGYPPGTPAGVPTTDTVHGILHNVASILVFASLPAACFVFARRFAAQPGSGSWKTYSFLTGIAVPVLIASTSIALFNGGPAGLFQRLSLSAGLIWIALIATRTIAEVRDPIAAR